MNNDAKNLTIGGLAQAASVGVETIRYYQRRQLLLTPERHYGEIRRYGQAEVDRLTFIRAAQGLGFSLDEVAELLSLDDGTHCDDASVLAERKLAAVRDKIAGLQSVERVLSELLRQCRQGEGKVHCPVIRSLQAGLMDVPANR